MCLEEIQLDRPTYQNYQNILEEEERISFPTFVSIHGEKFKLSCLSNNSYKTLCTVIMIVWIHSQTMHYQLNFI